MKTISIIGGGPAALMLASQLDTNKYKVALYEKKKTPGRKFLVAGEGGLNLTYNSSIEQLIAQYVPSEFIDGIIRQFTNEDLIRWLNEHGVATFIGSSHRVFPDLDLKPIEVLNTIVEYVVSKGVIFQYEQKFVGWNEQGRLHFEEGSVVESDIVVFAMGGASWKVTGSDGTWSDVFQDRGISVQPFRAANCAFSVDWQKDFISAHEGKPLKNIALSYQDHRAKGELVISKFGLEGNALYALSQKIQESLLLDKTVKIYLDLKPTMTVDQIKKKYKNSRSSKVTDVLKSDLNLDRTSIALIKQCTDKSTFLNPDRISEAIKALPIVVESADELDKAISSLGGIALNEIDSNFQLKKIPNTYAIGEMLDWYAPTGGYLLQACFSMGFALADHLNNLDANEESN